MLGFYVGAGQTSRTLVEQALPRPITKPTVTTPKTSAPAQTTTPETKPLEPKPAEKYPEGFTDKPIEIKFTNLPKQQIKLLPQELRFRLSQDINVNPIAPRPNMGYGTIGTNTAQAQELLRDLQYAIRMGATDIRVNQEQVNLQGVWVGINKPDLQYTLKGQRYYFEYDQPTGNTWPNSPRGSAHAYKILSNDPNGIVRLKVIK
jgi:hypothetical protein